MKRGIVILLYSVALLGVLGLILISTYDPQNFTVEIGQAQKEIVKVTEINQNYQNFLIDNANFVAEELKYLSNQEEYKTSFVSSFESRMNQYPDYYEDYLPFEYSVYLDYDFVFTEKKVDITGSPSYIIDYQEYMANDDFIDFEEKLIRDYILVTGVNSEFKFYPYFKITSDFALNNPDNSE